MLYVVTRALTFKRKTDRVTLFLPVPNFPRHDTAALSKYLMRHPRSIVQIHNITKHFLS